VPLLGRSTPASIRSVVVLPAPLGPSRPTTSPDAPQTTVHGPPPGLRTAGSGPTPRSPLSPRHVRPYLTASAARCRPSLKLRGGCTRP
jgi:hypothetical protein